MSSTAQHAGAKLGEIKQKVEAAAPKKLSGIDLYSRFAFAGAVCCSVTHGGLTPVDVYVPRPFPVSP
jgi:solute carrier family 25 phosphate transporter 3